MSVALPKMGINFTGLPLPDMLPLVQEADKAGIHFASVGEGLALDTFTVLGAIAAVTQRIRLVSGIATWTRTPVNAARACRSLDQLSNGRYTFGLGSMPRVWSEEHHGIPADAPLSRMREYVELVRMVWSSGPDSPVNFEGRFYRVSGYRFPEPPPARDLPILLGVSRPRTIRAAGEWTDGAIYNWNYAVPWLQERGLPPLEEGARRSGRALGDLERQFFMLVYVTHDQQQAERARAAVRHHVSTIYMGIDYHQELLTSFGFGDEVAQAAACLAQGDSDGAALAVSDRMVDSYSIIGTAEECRQRVAEYTPYLTGFALSAPTQGFTAPERVSAVRRLIQTFGEGAAGTDR